MAAGILASRRESWRDLRQDLGEILAAGNFASRQESCREEKSRRPKSRRDPGGIPAEIAAGSRQDPGPYFTRGCPDTKAEIQSPLITHKLLYKIVYTL